MTSIVWDMGGTLVNTYPEVDRMFQECVRRFGGEIELIEVARLTRQSTGHAIDVLSERFGIPETELEEAYSLLKSSWESDAAPLMPGAKEVMEAVRRQGGLNLIVTHRDRESATTLVDQLGIDHDGMICAPDGYARKPDPEMFVTIMADNGVDPSTAIAVGDRLIDVEAAAAAGLRTVFFETPRLPVDSPATWEITDLRELEEIIHESNG